KTTKKKAGKRPEKSGKNTPISRSGYAKLLYSAGNAKKCKKIHGFLCAKTGLTDYAVLLFSADTLPAHLQHISTQACKIRCKGTTIFL
ncbi:MAG: hypothetical protein IJP45_05970, partial [Paludibacteraceae bacterium]|nr:hypothetical protein [Paludibacteraceae bacterium]